MQLKFTKKSLNLLTRVVAENSSLTMKIIELLALMK